MSLVSTNLVPQTTSRFIVTQFKLLDKLRAKSWSTFSLSKFLKSLLLMVFLLLEHHCLQLLLIILEGILSKEQFTQATLKYRSQYKEREKDTQLLQLEYDICLSYPVELASHPFLLGYFTLTFIPSNGHINNAHEHLHNLLMLSVFMV